MKAKTAANGTVEFEMEKVKAGGEKKRLLLHACCAPCASSVLEYVTPYFYTDVFFCNPNIMPREEFEKRLAALKLLLKHFENVRLIVPPQPQSEFLKLARGLEQCPEGGERCKLCFSLRLDKTAEYAASLRDGQPLSDAVFKQDDKNIPHGRILSGQAYEFLDGQKQGNAIAEQDDEGLINGRVFDGQSRELMNEQFLQLSSGQKQSGSVCKNLKEDISGERVLNGRLYDFFATTLTLSPHKNAAAVNAAGFAAAAKFNTEYLASDFKKRNGYLRSIELCREWNIYRQNYCGCRFDCF
jgi:predicted adenine nucleotide alpha hydrolase (AANH) superfamily ATPase